MVKGFRDFILRGNVVDLAVGVIMGAAFGAIVNSLSADIITPLIAFLFGSPTVGELTLGPLLIGNFLNAIISFFITAFAIYFLVVLPINKLMDRFKPQSPEPQRTKKCPDCLSDVPLAARRCAFCTSTLTA